jgi:putative GTP pyrophosphokinase
MMTVGMPHFDSESLDRAGAILVTGPDDGSEQEWLDALELINQWGGAHSRPLNAFQVNLRIRVGPDGIVARRLKRLPSIRSKLERLSWLKLSRMQDIGGCRAVVSAADDAFNLAADLADSRIRHTLVSYNNYIDEPRRTGYRGIHLVYSYHSDRVDQWQGLNTEIQIRSQFQHQWATAVETVGTFTGDELKSGRGSADWLRFFALMSSFIAGLEEKAIVPDTPANDRELFDEIGRLDATLGITERLAAFQSIAASLTGPRRIANHWVVLELDLQASVVTGHAFRPSDLDSAIEWDLKREMESREEGRIEIVLVSSSSLSELRRAYPNFFADLSLFRLLVREAIDRS